MANAVQTMQGKERILRLNSWEQKFTDGFTYIALGNGGLTEANTPKRPTGYEEKLFSETACFSMTEYTVDKEVGNGERRFKIRIPKSELQDLKGTVVSEIGIYDENGVLLYICCFEEIKISAQVGLKFEIIYGYNE